MQRRSFPGFLRMPPPVFFPKNAKILLICQRFTDKTVHLCCRPPRGGRGLKCCRSCIPPGGCCRPPRGGRGLKLFCFYTLIVSWTSPPSRGAWIEIIWFIMTIPTHTRRPPRGGRGLKSRLIANLHTDNPSPPSRGAWIEIMVAIRLYAVVLRCRPPRGGRGLKFLFGVWVCSFHGVAPLAGGVD